MRVQGGGSWLSSGSWNNEDVQYVYRNNWNCKRSNKRSIDPNQVFRYSEEDVPKIAKQVFHGTETCNLIFMKYDNRIKTIFRENIFENIFRRRMRKSLLFWNCTCKYDKKGAVLDHLENNTIEFE